MCQQPQTRYAMTETFLVTESKLRHVSCTYFICIYVCVYFMYVCKQMRIFFSLTKFKFAYIHVLVMYLYARLWLVKMPKHVALLKE